MGKSIGNIRLLEEIKKRMVNLICLKNECLSKGVSVTDVNKKLKLVYSYWALFKDCSLTDEEINCVYNDLGTDIECGVEAKFIGKGGYLS